MPSIAGHAMFLQLFFFILFFLSQFQDAYVTEGLSLPLWNNALRGHQSEQAGASWMDSVYAYSQT